jgi:hypothetical protein
MKNLFIKIKRLFKRPQRMTDKDRVLASIGAILVMELRKSRELRRKIRGTNLESKLKKYI